VHPVPKVKIHEIEIDKKRILVVEVKKSEVLCSVGGIAYIRIGTGIRPLSVQEVVMLSSEMGTINWDEVPIISRDAIKGEYLEWYFSRIYELRGRKIEKCDWERYLRSVRAMRGEKLTNAGVLFFTDANTHIPHCGGRILFMRGNEVVESREYAGPVWKVIDDMYSALLREISKEEVVLGTKRNVMHMYPPRAIREALINAFAHRNYAIATDVKVFVYSDKIVVRSPGSLVPGVDINDPDHIPRNPTLCTLLYDVGYIERYGYGLKMIRDVIASYPWLALRFNSKGHKFEVIFEVIREKLVDDVDRKILELLSVERKSGELSKMLGVSKPTVLKRIKRLEQMGLVKSVGSGAHKRYVARR